MKANRIGESAVGMSFEGILPKAGPGGMRMLSGLRRLGSAVCTAAMIGTLTTWPAWAQELDEELLVEVRALVEATVAGDDAALDEALCIDVFVPANLARSAALGLIDDPDDAVLVDDYSTRYRAASKARLLRWAERGGEVNGVDSGALAMPAVENTESVDMSDTQGDSYQVSEQGEVVVQWAADDYVTYLSFARIGDRWCAQPVNVNP